jgi:hypothetical protein
MVIYDMGGQSTSLKIQSISQNYPPMHYITVAKCTSPNYPLKSIPKYCSGDFAEVSYLLEPYN